MTQSRKRKELEHAVSWELGREMSARTILFHQAMADFAGVTVTDMKCLDYIERGGEVTAGDLARITGLTTGAITAAIDRLEKAGYARRERSDADRRKVFIRTSNSPKLGRLWPFYQSLGNKMEQLVAKFSTRELETVRDFMVSCTQIVREQAEVVTQATKK